MSASLNSRAEVLLRTLITRYIEDGSPVGSRTLAKQAGLELSPATIRNVMADLEEMGLVRSPHTSAGRIPTQAGYRMFVDSLLRVQALDTVAIQQIQGQLKDDLDPRQRLSAAMGMLSNITHMAAVVSVPKAEEVAAFRQIEFLKLARDRILVIMITMDGQVQNRVFTTDKEYSEAELVEAANYFSQTYSGQSLTAVKRHLLGELKQDGDLMQRYVRVAMEMAQQVFEGREDEGLLVSGESNLMDFPDLGDIRTLRRLFDAFGTKQDLLHLLDRSMKGSGVKIFIGSESGYDAFEDCSVVTAPYSIGDNVVGTLGVVGPTRMSYDRVIPIVDITARILSGTLNPEE